MKIPLIADGGADPADIVSLGTVYLRRPSVPSGVIRNPTTLTNKAEIACGSVVIDNETVKEENVILSNKPVSSKDNKDCEDVADLKVVPVPIVSAKCSPGTGLRKRNVNFKPNTNEDRIAADALRPLHVVQHLFGCDDDGFESFNGKSSSGEDNTVQQQRSALNHVPDIGRTLRKVDKNSDNESKLTTTRNTVSDEYDNIICHYV